MHIVCYVVFLLIIVNFHDSISFITNARNLNSIKNALG